MEPLHIITPVKDSIDLTMQTIRSVMESKIDVPHKYTIYNDYSTQENTEKLRAASVEMGFNLVNLQEITQSPSPNYDLTLKLSREKAIKENACLLIIESDVVVQPDTIRKLYNGALSKEDCAIAACVTTDENGKINYPYLWAKNTDVPDGVKSINKHCSFCCSLLTNRFLNAYDFGQLDPTKNWYDVHISKTALRKGFRNYLFLSLPVWHRPHASRPWKQLKYTSPLKYYFLKIVKGLDKI